MQRDLDSGLGEEVRGDHVVDIAPDPVDVVDLASEQDRRHIALDDHLHGLYRLPAPPRTAGYGALADTGDATGGAQEHQQHRLSVHARAGKPVGATERYVEQNRFDAVDPQIAHGDAPSHLRGSPRPARIACQTGRSGCHAGSSTKSYSCRSCPSAWGSGARTSSGLVAWATSLFSQSPPAK